MRGSTDSSGCPLDTVILAGYYISGEKRIHGSEDGEDGEVLPVLRYPGQGESGGDYGEGGVQGEV